MFLGVVEVNVSSFIHGVQESANLRISQIEPLYAYPT